MAERGKKDMIYSKLTSKFQATIPTEIRKTLKIKAGDRIIFEILPDRSIVIRKSTLVDVAHLKALEATVGEWGSKQDEEAYRDL